MPNIIIKPYNKTWPALFKAEYDAIRAAVPIPLRAIHHIGSTSVPGLSAKPIIDILIETDDLAELNCANKHFESLGYECMGEYGIPGRRFYRKGGSQRSHHIHAFETGSVGAQRHLAFRDYMRFHSEIAREYELLKTSVAASCNGNMDKYCDGKDAFVSKHESLALQWWSAA